MEDDILEDNGLSLPPEELEIQKKELTNPMEKELEIPSQSKIGKKSNFTSGINKNNMNKFNQSKNNFNFKNNNSFKSSNFRRRTP